MACRPIQAPIGVVPMEGLHIASWPIGPVPMMRGLTLLLKGSQLPISLHLHLNLHMVQQLVSEPHV